MNKVIIWGISIAVVLGLGVFLITGSSDTDSQTNSSEATEQTNTIATPATTENAKWTPYETVGECLLWVQ